MYKFLLKQQCLGYQDDVHWWLQPFTLSSFFSCLLFPLVLMALFNFTAFILTASVSYTLPDSAQHHSSTNKCR